MFRPNALKGSRRSAKPRGERLAARVFEVEKGSGGALLGVLVGARRHGGAGALAVRLLCSPMLPIAGTRIG